MTSLSSTNRSEIRPAPVLLLVCFYLLLNACAVVPELRTGQPENWQTFTQQQAGLDSWKLTARMGVQTSLQGGSVDVFWRQQQETFDIQLNAAMGQGAMRLQGNSDQVKAQLADGEVVYGRPQDLMQQAFDVSLPIDALVYWLRGLARAEDYSTAVWDEDGHLHQLQQDGWRVEMSRYQKQGDYTLPKKFYLESLDDPDTSIRVIIRNWQLNPT